MDIIIIDSIKNPNMPPQDPTAMVVGLRILNNPISRKFHQDHKTCWHIKPRYNENNNKTTRIRTKMQVTVKLMIMRRFKGKLTWRSLGIHDRINQDNRQWVEDKASTNSMELVHLRKMSQLQPVLLQ